MSQKKVSARTKFVLLSVGFIGGLYLLVVGFAYGKAWYDFRPYHKLGVELNQALGGGFTIKENNSCEFNETSCPSLTLTKSNMNFNLLDAKTFTSKTKSFFVNKSYEINDDLQCELDNGAIRFCGFMARNISKKTTARVGVDEKEVSITISNP